jgi:hypothetical protein
MKTSFVMAGLDPATHPARVRAPERHQTIVSSNSSQFGFIFSISAIFQSRFHFFKEDSL